MKTLFERLDAKWIPEPNTGCWLWMACTSRGYGKIGRTGGGAPLAAHRVMWERRRGPIPPGMYLDHTCRTRPCINPDHLRVVTPYVNTIENSRSVSALNTVKTHCPRGHPYAGYNLSVYQIKRTGRTGRYCKTCMRDRWRNRHAQIKGVL